MIFGSTTTVVGIPHGTAQLIPTRTESTCTPRRMPTNTIIQRVGTPVEGTDGGTIIRILTTLHPTEVLTQIRITTPTDPDTMRISAQAGRSVCTIEA